SPLIEMAHASHQMLSDALTALADDDASACAGIRRSDEQVDERLKALFEWAHREIPLDVAMTPAVIDILSIARKLERIADLATNIAEDVTFIVSGVTVRHGH